MRQLTIDPEFRDKIPPLSEDEFSKLEQNILEDGEVREPLVVWHNTIIDGHHRYKIVQKHPEIPFKVKQMDFPDKWAAMAYLVAPNSAVALWDSNAPAIYLKQADASGKPSIKVYDLVERTQKPVQASQPPVVEYAPLSRVEALEARLNELTVVKEMPVRTTKKTTTKEDAE